MKKIKNEVFLLYAPSVISRQHDGGGDKKIENGRVLFLLSLYFLFLWTTTLLIVIDDSLQLNSTEERD